MNKLSWPVRGLSIVGLIVLLFGLYALDFAGMALSATAQQAPLALLGMAAVDALVLSLAIGAAQGQGWRLATAVFTIFFGVKTALVAVEALYLPEVLPPALAMSLLVNGLITALIAAPAAVWLNGRWQEGPSPVPDGFRRSLRSWTGRLILAGFLWLILFVATGLLIFQPLAAALDADVAAAYLAAFMPENPMAVLGFQWLRGILWALLALPLLRLLGNGRRWRRGLVLGLLFAGLMGSGLLLPNDALPPSIQPAHLAEVIVENFVWGLLLVWLFAPRVRLELIGERPSGSSNTAREAPVG